MPKFYFDSYDGETLCRDSEASDLPSPEAARDLAMRALPEIARDRRVIDQDASFFYIKVLDEARRPIYMASLSLLGHWLDENR